MVHTILLFKYKISLQGEWLTSLKKLYSLKINFNKYISGGDFKMDNKMFCFQCQ